MAEFPLHPDTPAEKIGYDLHHNDKIVQEGKGEFLTDLLTRSPCLSHSTCLNNLSRKATAVIEQHDKSQPLFLYLAYQAPHGPINKPPQQYLHQYQQLGRFQQPREEGRLNRAGTILVTLVTKANFTCVTTY